MNHAIFRGAVTSACAVNTYTVTAEVGMSKMHTVVGGQSSVLARENQNNGTRSSRCGFSFCFALSFYDGVALLGYCCCVVMKRTMALNSFFIVARNELLMKFLF